MKRIAFILLALLMVGCAVRAEPAIDMSRMTEEQLRALIEAAELELAMQEERLIERAINALKTWYQAELAENFCYAGDGYLEIAHTQVIYIKDDIRVKEAYVKPAKLFENVAAIVEFVVLDDWYGTAPYRAPTFGVISVMLLKDGTLEVERMSLFNRYRSLTFDNDFSPIIESVSDCNGKFNNTWYLLK